MLGIHPGCDDTHITLLRIPVPKANGLGKVIKIDAVVQFDQRNVILMESTICRCKWMADYPVNSFDLRTVGASRSSKYGPV